METRIFVQKKNHKKRYCTVVDVDKEQRKKLKHRNDNLI